MNEKSLSVLKIRLDDVSQRIDARSDEFKRKRELSGLGLALMTRLERKRNRIRRKLNTAEVSGTTWSVVKEEIDRDIRALSYDLQLMDENRPRE
jgi:hypothetical protein